MLALVLAITLLFPGILGRVPKVVLHDVRPHPGPGVEKGHEVDLSGFDLLNSEIFLWGDEDTQGFANLTVFTPHQYENIISIGRFKGATTDITCSNKSIDIEFKNLAVFKHAQRKWTWVNNDKNHRFIIVADSGDCGWNEHRQPFLVQSVSFDETSKLTHLDATPQPWESLIHSYSLRFGVSPGNSSAPGAAKKRAVTKKQLGSIPWDHKLYSKKLTIPLAEDETQDIELECDSCVTQGSFPIFVYKDVKDWLPVGAGLIATTSGVSLTLNPKFTFNIKQTDEPLKLSKKLPEIPLSITEVPGVATLGPAIFSEASVKIDKFKASGTISGGIIAEVEDGSSVEFDLLPYVLTGGLYPPIITPGTGWNTKVTTSPLTVVGKIEGSLRAEPINCKLGIVAHIFGKGVHVDVSLAPYIGAKLSYEESSTGVCKNDNKHHTQGVKGSLEEGVEVKAEIAAEITEEKKLAEVTLYDEATPMGDEKCWGFGPTAAPAPDSNPSTPNTPTDCGDTTIDPQNCGECGKVCASGQVCVNSKCTQPTAKIFSPKIQPGAGVSPKAGWTVAAQDYQYWENDISLEKADYVLSEGRRTVNTMCMPVMLTGLGNTLPGDQSVIPAKSNLLFETQKPGDTDYCCLAYFENYGCQLVSGKYKLICEPFEGPSTMPIRSWQVYNCTGRYHVPGEPDPGCVGDCG